MSLFNTIFLHPIFFLITFFFEFFKEFYIKTNIIKISRQLMLNFIKIKQKSNEKKNLYYLIKNLITFTIHILII